MNQRRRPGMELEALERRQLLAGAVGGLTAQYFDNKDFTNLKVTRVDPQVNFNWALGSPDPAIGADTFSVKWTGQFCPTTRKPTRFTQPATTASA